MRWLLRFSVHHPWPVLGSVGAITLAASLFIPRVRLQLDARSLIPLENSSLAESDRAARLFGLSDVVVIGIANERTGIYTIDTLARIARLSEKLARVDGVVAGSVTSLATAPRLFVEYGKIETRPLLAQVSEPDLITARRIRHETEILGLNNGLLVAPDARAAAIFGEVKQDANRYLMLQQVRGLVAEEATGEDSLYLSGTALAQAVLGESAALDLARLIPAVIIVLGMALILAFRDLAPAFVSLTEIGVSLLWTVGLMGLNEQPVFVTTLVLPVILIAVGVSDDVYALNHYFNEAREAVSRPTREAVIAAFSGVVHPVSLTAASTIVGLLSLAATSLEPLRVFGIFGAVAILFSSLFSFTLVPALLVLIGPASLLRKPGGKMRGSRGMLMMLRILTAAGPGRILAVTLVAAACAALLATRLRVDDNWVRNLPDASDIYRGDHYLNNLLAGTTTLDLMVDSGQNEGFLQPEIVAALGVLEDGVAALPPVGAVHSVYSDIIRMNASLKGLSYSEYRESLQQGRLKLSRGEVEQALLLMSSIRRAPLGERLDSKYQRARMTVFIRFADYERIQNVLETASDAGLNITRAGGSVTPFGDGWISYLTVQLLVEGQVCSIGLALLTDLILLSLLLKSARTGLIAILPVGLSVLIVFAVLAVTKTPLGIANSMFASIAIGIGLDFSIHLTSAFRQGLFLGLPFSYSLMRAFIRTGPAIITSALAIAAGFSVLILSDVAPNIQLGLMICLSLLLCAAATLVLVPSLVLALRVAR